MQNWFDPSKKTEAAKWMKQEKVMACLRASLTPVARAVYKYSLGLPEEDQSKPHTVDQCPERVLWRLHQGFLGKEEIPFLAAK